MSEPPQNQVAEELEGSVLPLRGAGAGSYRHIQHRNGHLTRPGDRFAGGQAVLQMETDGIPDVPDDLLVGSPLGIAALKLRTGGKVSGPVPFHYRGQLKSPPTLRSGTSGTRPNRFPAHQILRDWVEGTLKTGRSSKFIRHLLCRSIRLLEASTLGCHSKELNSGYHPRSANPRGMSEGSKTPEG